MFEIKTQLGRDTLPFIDDFAQLRIKIFKSYPYLYDGSLEYEKNYLARYAEAKNFFLVTAYSSGKLIGASTALPLDEEDISLKKVFIDKGIDPKSIIYFGESVVLPEYRGHGLGHRFFDEREAYAKSLKSITTTCFCAVERPEKHPLRPAQYSPLNTFWNSRGYTKDESLKATFHWKDLDEKEESPKTMIFWTKHW